MIRSKSGKLLGLLGATLLVVAACTPAATPAPTAVPTAAPTATPTATPAGYHIGYSNASGKGNGFREEQVCTARAQALVSGEVSKLTVIHEDVDITQQLADIRTLIAADVDAIVFNPDDPAGLNAGLAEAHTAGIVTVSVDAYVTDPNTYNLYNNQIKYAELGAKWLFDQIGGSGTIYYMRGVAGHPADSDRDIGFNNVLADYPNITIVPTAEGVFTEWNPTKTTELITNFITSGEYDQIAGIWTSGMDSQVVDAIYGAHKTPVPIVGADLGAFVAQLLNPTDYPGLEGAAVTNTAAVGGAGVGLALMLLNGEQVATDPSASQPNTVLLDPVLATNTTTDGQALLASWQVDGLDPLWPLGLQIEGFTTYTGAQAVACLGPGE